MTDESQGMTLRLEVESSETPLLVTVAGEVVIGRRDIDSAIAPEIDLTSYGGYQKGISRYHAVFHAQDGQLRITDLDSHNGTYLNGYRIPPRQTAVVQNGDEVRLGQILLHVYIEDVPTTPESP